VSDVVRLVGLTKSYGRQPALRGIDLTVHEGEIFGYLGPNGAGKTTTLRLLLGLLRPSAGRATVFDLDCWTQSAAIRSRTGYLPGDPAMYERMTGGEILLYFANLRGRPSMSYASELAERLGLDLSRRVRALSRGNKQKLAIVQAFMSRPDLVILDEPTSGLDPLVQQEFHQLLRDTTAGGGTVLLSSHVLAEVQQMADRVGIIREGLLVAVERLEELRAKSVHRVEARLGGPVDLDSFASIPGVGELSLEGSVFRCRTPESSLDALVKALAHCRVEDLTITEADLEETFLTYYDTERASAA
jgi:ABC-2 type transport system ATP-binding protein